MRLFVAVTPDGTALEHLSRALLGTRELPGAPRWTAPALWHLTLAFLGEVEERKLPALRQGLAEVAARHPPITARLLGAGQFPPRGDPTVLWIGVREAVAPASPLGDLAHAVGTVARRTRIGQERRPFRAHLTVGRWRRGDPTGPAAAAALADYQGPVFELSGFCLVRSHLGPAPRHEQLDEWPLTGTRVADP